MRNLLATARPIAEDLAGTAVFYAIYLPSHDARLAAAIAIAIGLAQVAGQLALHRRAPPLLVVSVALSVVLGLATTYTNDPRLLLLQPAIIYPIVGATMLPRGWVIRYVPAIAVDLLPARTFDRVGWAWAALMFGTATANIALVAGLPPRRAAAIFAIAAAGSKLTLFAVQYAALRAAAIRHWHARQPNSDA